ncbi:MAG: DUF438 domain-containing protein [Chloroflexi bacterium]|nr:DUF438 domain-containing protein [Chloroflexota bacterium]
MTRDIDKKAKTEIMKDIIRKLHSGMTAEAAKERFEKEIGDITSTEIASLEQSLINEGISPEEIKKFCNVHALIFQSALEKAESAEVNPAHPVYLFRLENREIEKLTGSLKNVAGDVASVTPRVKETLLKLKGIDTHYNRKEQLLFPFLEKAGFMGPSKVMWGKDNEVRDLLKSALSGIDGIGSQPELQDYIKKALNPLIEEVEGMIFKEENILFPTSLEKLASADWVAILQESDDIGYVLIEKPAETTHLVKDLQQALAEEPVWQDGAISLPSGAIKPNELMALLNTLPVDLTFVDKDDTVRYFSEGRDRVFIRTRAVIGRKVQNCHPPQSVDIVEKILASFKDGSKDSYDFWINYRERLVYIRYFAMRDRNREYLGTLEVTQDVTDIKKLEGERRLLDERA